MNKTKAFGSSAGVTLLRDNPGTPGNGLVAYISPYFNTGWMASAVRCWLSSNVAESITATELVTDGGFDVPADWTCDASWSVASSSATHVAGVSDYIRSASSISVVAGKSYNVTFTVSNWTNGSVRVHPSGAFVNTNATYRSGNGTYTECLIAGGSGQLWFNGNNAFAGSIDSVSVQEVIADRSYKNSPLTINGTLAKTLIGGIAFYGGWSASNYGFQAYSADLDPGTGSLYVPFAFTIPTGVAAAGWGIDRSAATGAFYKIGHDATGKLTASVSDGTTTRTVTTTAAYNTGTALTGALAYSPSGTVTLYVGGVLVATATGTPLGSLSNATATCTVGIDRGLTAPWAGQLALLKAGMTVPTLEQAKFAYEQEKFLFMPGAICALPDANSVVDIAYDPMQDKLKVVSAANESSWTGLVNTGTTAVSSGSFIKVSHMSGVKLLARSTTNPGVDVTIPAYGLREELFNRAKAAADRARLEEPFDYSGGFQCTTTLNSTALTSVTGWTYPSQANPRGLPVSATGIPAGATITNVQGTTVYISAAATATASNVSVTTTDFPLPAGYEAKRVSKNGVGVQYVAASLTRVFDGFVERERLTTNPAYSDWLQVSARRMA